MVLKQSLRYAVALLIAAAIPALLGIVLGQNASSLQEMDFSATAALIVVGVLVAVLTLVVFVDARRLGVSCLLSVFPG